MVDSTLSWSDQTVSLTSKLNKACYAIRMVKSCMSLDVLRMIYFSYVHSITAYGIIFWGNSQKRIVRIINNSGRRDSCCKLFRELQILPLASQYILSILVFVNKNRELFLSNSDIHSINTRYNQNLHMPTTNLTMVQKGVLFSGSRIYNCLPSRIKALSNDAKSFKSTLKRYLLEHVFYSLEEYFQFQLLPFFILILYYSDFIYFYLLYNFTSLFICSFIILYF